MASDIDPLTCTTYWGRSFPRREHHYIPFFLLNRVTRAPLAYAPSLACGSVNVLLVEAILANALAC